jgi:hypothetical protein
MGVQAGDFSYLGVGMVYLREKGAAAPMLHIGNVSVLNFGVTEDVKEQRDYTVVGGGTVAEARRISAVECGMTLHDLDKDNLARAFFGTASELATEAVTGEVQLGYVGGFTPTNKPIDTSVAVTVAMGATTFVLGTDFEVSSGGITILADGDIEDGDALEIGYTTLDHQTMEAITTFAKEYELYFEGLNEAKSGRAVNVAAHRIKFGATQVLDLINEDFASFEVKGKLLRDNSKKGVGVSKYFKVQIALGE